MLGSSGAVSLNLVGNEYKDKHCVIRYEMPRLKIIPKTAVTPTNKRYRRAAPRPVLPHLRTFAFVFPVEL
jgi:hypothetical protein